MFCSRFGWGGAALGSVCLSVSWHQKRLTAKIGAALGGAFERDR